MKTLLLVVAFLAAMIFAPICLYSLLAAFMGTKWPDVPIPFLISGVVSGLISAWLFRFAVSDLNPPANRDIQARVGEPTAFVFDSWKPATNPPTVQAEPAKKFRWRQPKRLKPPPKPRYRYTKVVGVTFANYNGVQRQRVLAKCVEDEQLAFVRDARNPHDANAVMVVRATGEQLGFLRRKLAAEHAPMIDSGVAYHVLVDRVTGGGALHRGININYLAIEPGAEGYEGLQEFAQRCRDLCVFPKHGCIVSLFQLIWKLIFWGTLLCFVALILGVVAAALTSAR